MNEFERNKREKLEQSIELLIQTSETLPKMDETDGRSEYQKIEEIYHQIQYIIKKIEKL